MHHHVQNNPGEGTSLLAGGHLVYRLHTGRVVNHVQQKEEVQYELITST